jgi:hypothetical protein
MSDDRLKGISQNGAPQNNGGLKRRDLLLSSSTLLAASALSMSGLVNPAQAQRVQWSSYMVTCIQDAQLARKLPKN